MSNSYKQPLLERFSFWLMDFSDRFTKKGLKATDKTFNKIEKSLGINDKPIKKQQNNEGDTNMKTIVCPKCGSARTITGKRGYRVGVGILCGIFLTPLGALLGFAGSDKIAGKCLDCQFKWKFDSDED